MAYIKNNAEKYQDLKGASRKAGFVLKNYRVSRNLSNDGFIRVFKKIYPDTTYSFETITRARRTVQNTLNLFPKVGKQTEWTDAIRQLKQDGLSVQQDLSERA